MVDEIKHTFLSSGKMMLKENYEEELSNIKHILYWRKLQCTQSFFFNILIKKSSLPKTNNPLDSDNFTLKKKNKAT